MQSMELSPLFFCWSLRNQSNRPDDEFSRYSLVLWNMFSSRQLFVRRESYRPGKSTYLFCISASGTNSPQVEAVKKTDAISETKSSAAGSSLTKKSKRRSSFRYRRSTIKDSSLKLFSCLVSDVRDTEDASITSLKSEMPKSTKYQEKSSCSIQ